MRVVAVRSCIQEAWTVRWVKRGAFSVGRKVMIPWTSANTLYESKNNVTQNKQDQHDLLPSARNKTGNTTTHEDRHGDLPLRGLIQQQQYNEYRNHSNLQSLVGEINLNALFLLWRIVITVFLWKYSSHNEDGGKSYQIKTPNNAAVTSCPVMASVADIASANEQMKKA